MSQVKIYGLRSFLFPIREKMSDVLHSCIMDAFQYPAGKRVHRFFHLEEGDFFYPEGRTNQYVIIEIALFEGRSTKAKKVLYQLIFSRFQNLLGIAPDDVEITLTETPLYNWGIRGKPGDELSLDYKIVV